MNPRVSKIMMVKQWYYQKVQYVIIKNHCGSEILSNLDLKALLSKIPFLISLLIPLLITNMNEIVNKFLLSGDKSMPEIYLKQPGFTYSACGPFTKSKEKIQKLTKNRRYEIYLQKWIRQNLFSTWYGL